MNMVRPLMTALFALAVASTVGCSTFNRDWERAVTSGSVPAGIEGAWDGQWLSDANGHRGRLRCLVTERKDRQYEARFHANYQKILSFGYTVLLDVRNTNGVFKFAGDAELGWFAGGKYHYEGEATSNSFFSTYQSKHDHGTFKMGRGRRAERE